MSFTRALMWASWGVLALGAGLVGAALGAAIALARS
jgi:hypothetical protein